MDATMANEVARDYYIRVVYGALREFTDRHQPIISAGDVMSIIQDVLTKEEISYNHLPEELRAIYERAIEFACSSSSAAGSISVRQLLDELDKLLN